MEFRPVLVVDPDDRFTAALTLDSQKTAVPLMVVKTAKEAQKLISDSSKRFSAVFVSWSVNDAPASAVLRDAHLTHPATPAYVLISADVTPSAVNAPDWKGLPVQQIIQKPVTYRELLHHFAPIALIDGQAPLKEATGVLELPDASEILENDSEFIPIRADDFMSGTSSLFDVFVRLDSGKYLKLLNAKDSFNPDRIAAYINRGVHHFHIRRLDHRNYLEYCDQITQSLLNRKAKTDESKRVQIVTLLNQGQETLKYLQTHGITSDKLQLATNFVKNVERLIHAMNPGKEPLIRGLLADIATYEHSISTTILSGLLAHQLNMSGDQSMQIIGMAAMFHDIGLIGAPWAVLREDESRMSEEEKKIFYAHPSKGAEALRQIKGIHPVTIQAVEQHHERFDNQGFPNRLGAGKIHRVAELIGISNEFALLIEKATKMPSFNVFQEMEKNIYDGFSSEIVTAFRKVFLSGS